jgi:hypothetical protein
MESAASDGEHAIALQCYRFACRIGPVVQQEQQARAAWREQILGRLGSALANLISGWLLDRVCVIMGR